VACTLAALALAGCASAPRVIPLDPSAVPAKGPASIASYEDAFRAVGGVFARDLGLPVPRVTLHLYPHREAFARGMRDERVADPALVQDTAGFARGLGSRDKILVNEAMLARTPWPERTRFLAHELTHTVQYHLAAGRRGTSEQWLREGYAEWVSYRTTDALGLQRYEDGRALRQRLFTAMRERKPPPALGELETFAQWVSMRSKLGQEATYGQGFLATDYLIGRTSPQAAIEYFRLFARSDDRRANFRKAFGLDPETFEREVGAYLAGLR
jgi:hypothetical protein